MLASIYCIYSLLLLSSYLLQAFYVGSRQLQHAILSSRTKLGLTTADFKNGLTFEIDGKPVKLLEFLHVKPGKGSAFVRAKVKHLLSGTVQERTFRAGETIVEAEVIKTDMQYTYKEGEVACFMNLDSFEEQRIGKDKLGNNFLLLRDGLVCQVTTWNDDVIDFQLPANVEYTVVETDAPIKGNSGAGSGGQKTAILDSGAQVNVPLFIEAGEKVMIATDTMQYLGRSNK